MTFDEAFERACNHYARREFRQAIEAYRQALEHDPSHPEAWHLKGLAEHHSGLDEAALASARRAIALGGERPPFVLFEGDLLHDRGDLAGAEERFARIAADAPGWVPALMALGRVRMDRGDYAAACEAFRAAVAAQPANARAWNNLGVALEKQDHFDEALGAFERAVGREPGYALGHLNLARATDGRDSARALEHAETAARLAPELADAWLTAGDIYRRRFALEEALATYDRGLAASPGDARLFVARADILSHMDRIPESEAAFRAAAERFPASFKAALGANLLLPRVYESREQVLESREKYAAGLERVHEVAGRFEFASPQAALADARWVNFYLAYQGQDDRRLQERYGELLQRVLRPHVPEFFAPRGPGAPSERIRVGFLSHFFFNSVVGRYFGPWVANLDRDAFEVFVYYTNETLAEDTKRIAAAAHTFRHVAGRPLDAVARQVIADDLDVLVYPELGMHQETFVLASLRLARVQCAAWGHPTTTGLQTIDWFLSAADMEPQGAEAHYSERLATLPGLGTRYALPEPASPGERPDFGIPEGKTAYLMPQSLFKIHPDNDDLIASVLERDPEGVAVFFESFREPHTQAFKARLGGVLARRGLDLDNRARFLRFAPHAQYLRVNELCDVMLDTLHWSGGNTSLDALASGLPVVTLPGELMRGRQSSAMLRQLGVPELIASTPGEYVEIATRIGRSSDEREAFSRRIRAALPRLFERDEPIRALEAFLRKAVQG